VKEINLICHIERLGDVEDYMKVFISHSSIDNWVAGQISNCLLRRGHKTFLDEKDIKTGDSIDKAIQNHLKQCDHILVLITPSSLKSHWVLVEIGGAKALDKTIIPILLHVEQNEIPTVISQLLVRSINDLEKYFEELDSLDAGKVVEAPTEIDLSTKSIEGLKVGEKVRIIHAEHLTDEDKMQSPKWTKSMDKYSGVMTQIIGFTKQGNVLLAVDDNEFRWSPRWLTKLN
jgi:hypothetical protein